MRVIEFFLERCTYCARCAEVCQEKAITLTEQFETATDSVNDLHLKVDVFMGSCRRCGRCFEPATPLDKMMVTGFREAADDSSAAARERVS